jgi:protein TonB
MKLDLFRKQWLDMVFEGKNKSYGAYDLRKKSPKMTAMALLFGALFFALAIGAPAIIEGLFNGLTKDEAANDSTITTIKMPPKPKENTPPPPPPPPPPPKQAQVKFVKPVVAKAEDVTEEPPKITPELKKTGDITVEGNDEAPIVIDTGNGDVVEEDPNVLYDTAGIEVKPEFPGGIDKFYKYVGNNYQTPEEEGLKGKVYVSFVVEKDGSLTDIKSVRDIGYGTGAEAVRVLKKCPRWTPGVQNGKPVRCTYTLPISIQSAE